MKFAYSTNQEVFYGDEDSVEEILVESGIEIGESVLVGEHVDFVPQVCGYSVIESLQEQAYELAGESADSYLSNVSKDKVELLSKYLTDTFNKWATEHSEEPSFYGIDNIRMETRLK